MMCHASQQLIHRRFASLMAVVMDRPAGACMACSMLGDARMHGWVWVHRDAIGGDTITPPLAPYC